MEVHMIHATPLWVCAMAIRRCWDSHDKSDTVFEKGFVYQANSAGQAAYRIAAGSCGEKDKELIDRVANKMKHESVKNHIHYTFDIQGISTKTLLALTRHDVGVEFSVQSTRYTTKKCVNAGTSSFTETGNDFINSCLEEINDMVIEAVGKNLGNDDISMLLPQAWNYNLIATFSMTALQHFLELRTKKDAHYDIQKLAHELYSAIPEDHKFLFTPYMKETDERS